MSLRVFRRVASVVLGLVGLVFVVVGVVQVAGQSWDDATGTVKSCTVEGAQSSAVGAKARIYHRCEVTWDAGDGTKTSTLEVDEDEAVAGWIIDLKVNDDTAIIPSPSWLAYSTALVGLALVLVALFLSWLGRRRDRQAAEAAEAAAS
ncbi:hypothetical protein [Actinoplanes sp. NPDC051851]|uniref:hypothetical protein n=1 Tax=Actinoplanes sp. NPDC051851 TaxID=3154753 RepID=UPI003423A7E8